ncbi:MAG: FAD-dependent oxidoreductase, partial [Candidatus Uhrbacteria bacterium]|nr:FAD-dependent oxidoreductase [Candidatus Uhrbacteria bacterium]
MKSKQIVIVGAGFVGLLVARLLRIRLPHQVTVTLIDSKDHFLFTPRLIDLLAGEHPTSLRIDIQAFAKKYGFDFVKAEVKHVDRATQQVSFEETNGSLRKMTYDKVVVCCGARPSFYDVPGARQYAFPLKAIEHVERIHAQANVLLSRARLATKEKEKRALLSFVAVGGGAAGIEALFALRQYVFGLCVGSEEDVKPYMSFALVQAAPQILSGFEPTVVACSMTELSKAGVKIFIGEPVTHVAEDYLATGRTERIPAQLILWCAGLEAHDLSIDPDAHRRPSGFIPVDAYLRVDENMFAGGDVAFYREKNLVMPKNAQTAFLMAYNITENIVRSLHHQKLRPFHYVSHGN